MLNDGIERLVDVALATALDDISEGKRILLEMWTSTKLNMPMPEITQVKNREVGSRETRVTAYKSYYYEIFEKHRILPDSEMGKLSAREQTIFSCIHHKSRLLFGSSAAATYEKTLSTPSTTQLKSAHRRGKRR